MAFLHAEVGYEAPAAAGYLPVEENWSYLRTDCGFHQAFWIADWPRQQVYPGFMHALVYVGDFGQGVQSTRNHGLPRGFVIFKMLGRFRGCR